MTHSQERMADEDLSRQEEEVEALSSIYGEDWCVLYKEDRTYGIVIRDRQDDPQLTLGFQVTMPPDYPSTSPPHYFFNHSCFTRQEEDVLCELLGNIYFENVGEIVIYQWVEKIREFMLDKSQAPEEEDSPDKADFSAEAKEDDADDDFDPSVIEGIVENMAGRLNIVAGGEGYEMPPIYSGESFYDRRSVFQAHLAPVFYDEQVKMVMDKLRENKKIAEATHRILAYRIEKDASKSVWIQGCDDDGEFHASSRMLHLMQIVEARNVMVVVTRWYGGVHLGPDRFKHISNLTRNILQEHGYIKEKESKKKGPRSGHGKKH